jgi:hypothetical protein
VAFFSCKTSKTVSDAEKEKVKGEVKEVVNAIFKAAEEANYEMIVENWLDSPDFIFTYNGTSFGYKDCEEGMKPIFAALINQKGTIVDEKFAVPDNSTVIYTANTTWLMNFKDGHSVLQDPWFIQIVFKKTDGKWKVITSSESGVEKNVAGENSNGLNQVELVKQILGTWKAEIAKDTFYTVKYQWLGTGMEGAIKIITKGKTVQQGKAIIGYDKKIDKIIETDLMEGSDIMLYALWFTSKNTCTEIPYEYISNPEKAPVTWQYEIKSPDVFVWNYIENGKTTTTYTFQRIN